MPAAERVVLVSDLHLGAGTPPTSCESIWGDLFRADQEFHAFASWLVRTDTSRMVLLGDTIDFHRVPVDRAPFARCAAQAVDQLSRVADAHPQFFDAVAKLLDAGLDVDVVVGNHDVELARPEVQQQFAALVGRPTWSPSMPGQSLRFHNWFLYLPGLLYAEHGNHHHDINSFDRPLQPFVADRVERPLAARLNSARLLTAPKECRPPRRTLLADLMPGHRVSRRLRHAYRRDVLPGWAEREALPAAVVDTLHRMGSAKVGSIARRVIMFRLLRSQQHSFRAQAPRVAAAILELLHSAEHAVQYCVFGHTHTAAEMLGGRRGGYLNCGTWATDPARLSPGMHESQPAVRGSWVEIARDPSGEASAALRHWAGHAAN